MAFKIKKQLQDEQNWWLGQYFFIGVQTAFSRAIDKNSTAEYPKKPFFAKEDKPKIDPEANEKLAVMEMKKYIAVLKEEGELPMTIITDIRRRQVDD